MLRILSILALLTSSTLVQAQQTWTIARPVGGQQVIVDPYGNHHILNRLGPPVVIPPAQSHPPTFGQLYFEHKRRFATDYAAGRDLRYHVDRLNQPRPKVTKPTWSTRGDR